MAGAGGAGAAQGARVEARLLQDESGHERRVEAVIQAGNEIALTAGEFDIDADSFADNDTVYSDA